jgi:hypothetical protein
MRPLVQPQYYHRKKRKNGRKRGKKGGREGEKGGKKKKGRKNLRIVISLGEWHRERRKMQYEADTGGFCCIHNLVLHKLGSGYLGDFSEILYIFV